MLQRQSESVFRDRCGHIVRLFPKKLRSVAHENARPRLAQHGRSFGPSPKAKESLGAKPRYCITVFMPPALDRPFKMTSRMECSRRMKSSRSENARSKTLGIGARLRPADKLVKSKVRHSSVGKGGHSNAPEPRKFVPRDGGCASLIHPYPPARIQTAYPCRMAYPASRICTASVCGIVRYSRSFPSRRMCPPMEQMYPSKPRARICGSMCRNGRPVLIMRMCPALCVSVRHARFRERRGPMSRSSRPHQKRGSFYSYFYYHPPTVCQSRRNVKAKEVKRQEGSPRQSPATDKAERRHGPFSRSASRTSRTEASNASSACSGSVPEQSCAPSRRSGSSSGLGSAAQRILAVQTDRNENSRTSMLRFLHPGKARIPRPSRSSSCGRGVR